MMPNSKFKSQILVTKALSHQPQRLRNLLSRMSLELVAFQMQPPEMFYKNSVVENFAGLRHFPVNIAIFF